MIREELCLKNFVEEGFLVMQEPPSLFRQKGVIKVSQVAKTHTAYHFGLCHLTPSNPVNFPSIDPSSPPKLLYHYLNVITKPQWYLKHPMA